MKQKCLSNIAPTAEPEWTVNDMVVEVRMKDGSRDKYCKVVHCGVLGSYRDKLYIQTRARGNVKEIFIDLATIDAYSIREPM